MKINKEKYIGLIAKESGVTKSMVEDIYNSMEKINQSIVLEGNDVPIPKIGFTELKVVKEKPLRERRNPKTNEKLWKEPEKAYNKLGIKVNKNISELLREKTEDNLF